MMDLQLLWSSMNSVDINADSKKVYQDWNLPFDGLKIFSLLFFFLFFGGKHIIFS